jgi:hypothetical protein
VEARKQLCGWGGQKNAIAPSLGSATRNFGLILGLATRRTLGRPENAISSFSIERRPAQRLLLTDSPAEKLSRGPPPKTLLGFAKQPGATALYSIADDPSPVPGQPKLRSQL